MQCYLRASLHTFIKKKFVKQKQKRLKKIRSQEIIKRQTSFTYNTSGRFLDKTHWQIPCHHNDQSDSSVLRPDKHLHQYPYIPWHLEIIVNIRTIVRIPRERSFCSTSSQAKGFRGPKWIENPCFAKMFVRKRNINRSMTLR